MTRDRRYRWTRKNKSQRRVIRRGKCSLIAEGFEAEIESESTNKLDAFKTVDLIK